MAACTDTLKEFRRRLDKMEARLDKGGPAEGRSPRTEELLKRLEACEKTMGDANKWADDREESYFYATAEVVTELLAVVKALAQKPEGNTCEHHNCLWKRWATGNYAQQIHMDMDYASGLPPHEHPDKPELHPPPFGSHCGEETIKEWKRTVKPSIKEK